MIKKFSRFWIDNPKISIVVVVVSMLVWTFSYIFIPKQYNPTITVPAFNIIVPAPWFSSKEVENLVVEPVEKRIYEINGIDHVYGIAHKDFWVITVNFVVWMSREKATTLLYNKIFENLDNKPLWVKDPIIKQLNSDDFPIYTFAILDLNSNADKTWENQNIQTNLRKIWKDIVNQLSYIPWTSVLYLVWWYKDNINVVLNLNKLEWKNINIMQVYNAIKNNNLNFPWWNIKLDKIQWDISLNWDLSTIDKLKKLIIWNYNWQPIYLEEVAKIFKWFSDINHYTFVNSNIKNEYKKKTAIFIWVAKQVWINEVSVDHAIKDKLKDIQKTLPKNYKIISINDEWAVAENWTNELLKWLIESIIIVFLVLWFFLGIKDALNAAVSIPLVLALVFFTALLLWDNVNRVVLFALILALGMLVDNSAVVIENIEKKLWLIKTNEDKKEVITEATWEVATWVTLATIVRILALSWMIFVSWMMWSFVWWVPKYVIISLLISLFIAFSINPYLAYVFYKNKKITHKEHKDTNFDLWYKKILWKFIWKDKKQVKKRWIIKKLYFLTLIVFIVYFPFFWSLKIGILPKDNANEIYVWVDWQDNWSIKKSKQVADYINNILSKFEYKWEKDLEQNPKHIIKDISCEIGIAPIIDFNNAFRWVSFRKNSNQISCEISFLDKDKREYSSIDFTEMVRKYIEAKVWDKYPNSKIRVLENPVWPPVRANFLLKVNWSINNSYQNILDLTKYINKKIQPIFKREKVYDTYTSIDTYKTDYIIKINHKLMQMYWLSAKEVAYTLHTIFASSNINIAYINNTKEPLYINLSVDPKEKDKLQVFDKISFMNMKWQKIFLKQFAKLEPTNEKSIIYTDDKYKTAYIYWTVSKDNTILYPALTVKDTISKQSFWWKDYTIISSNPYQTTIKSNITWNIYVISWSGSWKMALDTYKDLWTAMIVALMLIYFLLVAQFKSFKTAWGILMTFQYWMLWILPGYALLYYFFGILMTAPSMIWFIALAWIIVWNTILLVTHADELIKKWIDKKEALIEAWIARRRAILITALWIIFWSLPILWDPVWWGLGWSIVLWLTVAVILTLFLAPIFLYDMMDEKEIKEDL